MKRFLICLALMFGCIVCITPACQAQFKIEPIPPAAKPQAKKEYEKQLKAHAKWSNNLSNPEHYKDVVFKHKKTGEVVPFTKLSDFEKQMWYLLQGEQLTKEMQKAESKWKDEANAAKPRPDDEGDDEDEKKEQPPWKEEVQAYVNQLHDLRKKTAVKFETLAEKVFSDNKDKLSAEEKEFYLKRLRALHDQDKLVERKKD
jgi:hypothetical protein